MTGAVSQDPCPAAQGDKVTIKIDTSTLTLPETFNWTIDPGGGSGSHTVTSDADAEFDIDLPDDATGGTVTSSSCPDFAIAIKGGS